MKNALDVARDSFSLLVAGPLPAAIDGRLFPGLPDRWIAVDEVRDLLLARRCTQATRDAVWAYLVARARREGGIWTVVAVGVALPALTSVAASLTASFAGDPEDLVCEVLRGFLTGVTELDLSAPRIMVRLRWAAYRAGHHALREALDGPSPMPPGYRSSPPTPPWGHPDLVLAAAVRAGVLTRTEADLISSTRLGDTLIADWAAEHDMAQMAAYQVRWRAERRLVAYLRDTQADPGPVDPVADQVTRYAGSPERRRVAGPVGAPVCTDHGPSLPPVRTPPKGGDLAAVTPRGAGVDSPSEGPALSRSVIAVAGKKVRLAVSKNASKSGVQGRGESPRSTTSEEPRCA